MTTKHTPLTSWPPERFAFEKLCEHEEIDYGKTISWKRIEHLFNLGVPRESWKFRGAYFGLRHLIEQEGFLVTERGMDQEGVRILQREEMADTVKHKEHGKAEDSLRKSLTLSKVPRNDLSPANSKKLDHWETKTAVLGATAKVLLRKRSLPGPEEVIKKLKGGLK